jgi:putative heme-binding domain-containing protein
MLQRVLIAALLLVLAVIVLAAIARQAVSSPFQLKLDPDGKVPYSAALVKELLADAKAHGDARRGAVVFRAATSACLSCHKIGKQGGEVGPNLSAVGACIPPEEVVEGVFWPNRTVKAGFQAVAVELANGQVIQGIVKNETSRELVLQDAVGKPHRIPKKKEIRQRRTAAAGQYGGFASCQRRAGVRHKGTRRTALDDDTRHLQLTVSTRDRVRIDEQPFGKDANGRHLRPRHEPARRHQVFHLVDDLQVDRDPIVRGDVKIHRRSPKLFLSAIRAHARILYYPNNTVNGRRSQYFFQGPSRRSKSSAIRSAG